MSRDTSDTPLLPCPFCGGRADESELWAYCADCGVGYEDGTAMKGHARQRWNTRTPSPEESRDTEDLRDVLADGIWFARHNGEFCEAGACAECGLWHEGVGREAETGAPHDFANDEPCKCGLAEWLERAREVLNRRKR